MAVSINGAAATDSADSYAVKPGDTVEITPSQGANWSSSSSPAGITVQGLASTPTRWSAQLVNTTTAPATYTLTASADASAKSVQFVVAGGDARNGSFRVYSTSGARFALALNFDTKTYAFTGSNNGDADASGTFSADPNEAGTYLFSSSRITTAVNTARFRVKGDTVMGAFPFTLMHKTPAVVAIRPFIAPRAVIDTQASLDGVYNRFGLGLNSTDDTSQITQVEIYNGGTKLDICNNLIIYSIDTCPTIVTNNIAPSATTPGAWQLSDAGTGAPIGTFAVATVGDGKVYLSAGPFSSTTTDAVFRVGVSDKSTWQVGTGHGSATPGSWGAVALAGNNTSTRIGIATNGTAVNVSNTYLAMVAPDPSNSAATVPGPQGMRFLPGTNAGYFAMQGAGLHVIIGANNVPQGTNGYMQLNLMD